MKKILTGATVLLGLIIALVVSALSLDRKMEGTTETASKGSSSRVDESTQPQPKLPYSMQDLDVQYRGMTINGSVPLSEIAEKLSFDLKAWYDGGQYIAACSSNVPNDNNRYVYYRAKYPSKESAEIEFTFWYNQTKDELMSLSAITLLSADIKTDRGICVGDDENSLTAAYGDAIRLWDLGDEVFYETDIEKTHKYDIIFNIDPVSRKITEISIDYNSNKTMEALGIDGFD